MDPPAGIDFSAAVFQNESSTERKFNDSDPAETSRFGGLVMRESATTIKKGIP